MIYALVYTALHNSKRLGGCILTKKWTYQKRLLEYVTMVNDTPVVEPPYKM